MRKYFSIEELVIGNEYTVLELSEVYDVEIYLDNYEIDYKEIGKGILISIDGNPEISFNKAQEPRVFRFINHKSDLCSLEAGFV